MFWFLWIVFAIICVALVYFVLIQEPKQGGLSSSLGGSGSDMFNVRGVAGGLVRISVVLGGLFLLLALVLNLIPR